MASDYTDSFAGEPYFIQKGEQLSAAGMNAALNTKEKVANKTDTLSNSSTEYPSTKAVYDSLNEKDNNAVHKTGLETITGIKTFGTANAAAEPLLGMAKTTDAANDGTRIASEAQVYKKQDSLTAEQLSSLASLKTLSFFPKGTILTFSATAWDEASYEFRMIWKICDGTDPRTPDLKNKFIRGGTYAQYGEEGGTDTAQLPKHKHTFEGNNQTGEVSGSHSNEYGIVEANNARTSSGVFSTSTWGAGEGYSGSGNYTVMTALKFSMTPTGTIKEEGSDNADNKPAFRTLIFIMKVV